MPELTVTHIGLLAVLAIAGAVAGWCARDRRAAREKETIKSMWREEIARHRREQQRLAIQNKGLMEQVSLQQANQSNLSKQVAELSETTRDADVRGGELQRQLASRDAQIASLSNDLRNWQKRLPPLIDRYRTRDEEAERLEAALEAARAQIRELEQQRDEASAASTPAEPVRTAEALTDGLDASNDEEDEEDEHVEETEAEAAPDSVEEADTETFGPSRDGEAAGGGAAAGDPVRERDNLKKIKGVGPAIEKTLNEMGIFSFRQLAGMSDYDIDRVARRLKGFHGRIHREDWIGQARALLDKAASA